MSIAKSRKIKGGNYVQLATVETDPATGRAQPRCRSVVFRGFIDDLPAAPGPPLALKFITDARSSKVAQIAANSNSELVWWFSQTSEQYRVSGSLLLVGPAAPVGPAAERLSAERVARWKQLSDPAREQFFWQDPGKPFSAAESAVPPGGRDAQGGVLPPPEAFLLMLLQPREVAFLRLGDNFAQRCDWEGPDKGGWSSRRVNP